MKLPWSFRIRQTWALIVHGEDRRYDEAITTLQEVAQQLTREEDAHGITIDQRDTAEDWADRLAQSIAEHMREDIGEHSSANNPWANALELIDGTFCR